MSILKTTHAGSKALPITSKQSIIDEIAKLGYIYDCFIECWRSDIPNMPHLILQDNSFSNQSCLFTVYVYHEITRAYTISYTIISMSDLFNFIKDLKPICQS
jgi:hypothetical protein